MILKYKVLKATVKKRKAEPESSDSEVSVLQETPPIIRRRNKNIARNKEYEKELRKEFRILAKKTNKRSPKKQKKAAPTQWDGRHAIKEIVKHHFGRSTSNGKKVVFHVKWMDNTVTKEPLDILKLEEREIVRRYFADRSASSKKFREYCPDCFAPADDDVQEEGDSINAIKAHKILKTGVLLEVEWDNLVITQERFNML